MLLVPGHENSSVLQTTAKHAVRANAIFLAVRWRRFTLDRQIFRTDSRRSRTKGRENVPLGRRADAREVAYPILWLALDEASYVNGSVFVVCGGRSPSETLAGVPKVALDFLLRPARMMSRQHSGTKLSTRRGKLARRRQTAAAREGADMRYGSYAGCSACSAKNSPCLAPKSPLALEAWKHQQMIVETTCCARGSVRMR
jgi:hypothetical protein